LQLALGLLPPWLVKKCTFKVEEKQLDIYIEFTSGSLLACPGCGREGCKAYDTAERTWRHLNFFEHVTYITAITARLPRVECPDCGVQTVSVPWARDGSGFTLLFEAFILTLANPSLVANLAKRHLLVVDDWLRAPLTPEQSRLLLDLLDDRYRRRSTLLTSQLPVAAWHEQFKDDTIADVILDRLAYDFYRLELEGGFMRKITSPLT